MTSSTLTGGVTTVGVGSWHWSVRRALGAVAIADPYEAVDGASSKHNSQGSRNDTDKHQKTVILGGGNRGDGC